MARKIDAETNPVRSARMIRLVVAAGNHEG
jgi:hypothetical protein